MSRVRNANDFLLEFRKIRNDYEQLFGPLIAKVRKQYIQSPMGKSSSSLNESLEAHSRSYFVNALLAALNWRLDISPEDGLPNLVPEAPVESVEKGTTRFLDYLGLEHQTNRPLLVVETKRPNSPLPHPLKLFLPDISEIISRGLAGKPLSKEWSEWLATLRDYVCSVHAVAKQSPRRVVLTNGDWLILFLDPSDAFLDEGKRSPNRILVFSDRSDIERRYAELFRHLEHGIILGETRELMPGELSFHVTDNTVDRLMHGLRLRYIEQPGIYQSSPVIKVAPVIFLRSRYGAWLRIEAPPREYELPHKGDQLLDHLNEVQEAATDLLCQVNTRLGTHFQALPLSKHYEDEEFLETIRGVVEYGSDEFFVVTGDKTHYLLPEPSVPQCLHHDWAQSQATGVASNPGPIVARLIVPRSFFYSRETHHCAHRDVATAKVSQITAENRMRCGLRSGQDGNAFCEIYQFESHLCCRTCVFEEVCTKAQVFHLPC